MFGYPVSLKLNIYMKIRKTKQNNNCQIERKIKIPRTKLKNSYKILLKKLQVNLKL